MYCYIQSAYREFVQHMPFMNRKSPSPERSSARTNWIDVSVPDDISKGQEAIQIAGLRIYDIKQSQ